MLIYYIFIEMYSSQSRHNIMLFQLIVYIFHIDLLRRVQNTPFTHISLLLPPYKRKRTGADHWEPRLDTARETQEVRLIQHHDHLLSIHSSAPHCFSDRSIALGLYIAPVHRGKRWSLKHHRGPTVGFCRNDPTKEYKNTFIQNNAIKIHTRIHCRGQFSRGTSNN